MSKHQLPIDPLEFGQDLFLMGMTHAGAEWSSADMASGRQFAAEYLDALHQAEKDLAPEDIERAVNTGHAKLTREMR